MTMPMVKLTPTVLPLPTVRATMIGDLLANHGFSKSQIETAQRGYLAGWLDRVIVVGLDYAGHDQDVITLWFDKLDGEPTVSVDTSGGKSMLEAVSVSLAQAVAYGIVAIKRKGLRPQLRYGYAWWLDAATIEHARTMLGLSPAGSSPGCAPGYAMREVLSITPGRDGGTHYSHQVARKIR